MNLVKYIIVNGLFESDLTETCQELSNLYANPGFTAKNGQSEPLKTDLFEPLKKSFQTML